MKYSLISALVLGATATTTEELFMQSSENLELVKLKAGICQSYIEGTGYELSSFDKYTRDAKASQPTTRPISNYGVVDPSVEGDMTFLYKVCQPSYDLPKDFDNNEVCTTKRSAFMIQNDVCVYSFGHPDFMPTREENAEDGSTDLKSFQLSFTSDQSCNDAGPFSMAVTGVCNKNADTNADKWSTATVNECQVELRFKSSKACLPEIHVSGVIAVLAKFVGVILIINGLCMTFAGSKFLFLALASLVFFGTFMITMVGLLNLGLVSKSSPKGLLIGVLIGASVIGGLAAYFGYALAQAYAGSIISGAVGASIAIMLTIKVHNSMIKSVIIVLAVFIGIYIGQQFNKYVKSIGTAIIGGTMLVAGIAQYDDSAPALFSEGSIKNEDGSSFNIDEIKNDKKVAGRWIAYIGSWIVLVGLGSFIQLKYVASDDCDEDDMMNKDFA